MSWYEECYTRLLIDNHISEDDPSFMTRFDPANYVAMVKRGGIEAAMVYACDHNGNCYYPTKVGHQHANLHGRDIFGETVGLLHSEGIVPIAYTTVIFHNHSAKTHPSWRQQAFDGHQHDGRYWYSCPNSYEYRDYAKAEISEVIAYDIDGIFVDMVFWPLVCACPNCRSRYLGESGREIPHVVDWSDPEWVKFQRARERWMVEFVEELTECAKSKRPSVSVTHQFSPVLHGWSLGQSPGIAAACDYTSGDFYGGCKQQSLGAKVLSAFSRTVPFEFMTSRCVNLWDHTSTKSEEEMLCHAAMTLANGGACFFIDAVNPDGTLCPEVYDRLGGVNSAVRPFTQKMRSARPSLLADVGLYFSMPSHADFKDNGTDLRAASAGASNMQTSTEIQTIRETFGTSNILSKANIPYRVVTGSGLDLSGLKSLIINNATFMSEHEVSAIREFVRDGGTLIATGYTSLYDLDGNSTGDFQLSDVFGVSFTGHYADRVSYLTYSGQMDGLPSEITSRDTQFVVTDTPSPLVNATTASVLSRVSLTAFTPGDPDHYASIHSNPPGPVTDYCGLTVNSFGKGTCVYLYSSILALRDDSHQAFGGKLFKEHAASELLVSCNAPNCVEVTLLQSTAGNQWFLCFVNYQLELPNVPVHDISALIRVPHGKPPIECRKVSDGLLMEHECIDGILSVKVDVLETVEMVEILLSPMIA